mgnify:CR=1 FL=1
MINFIICDDNQIILDKLEKILNDIFSRNGFEAQVALKSTNVDEVLDFVTFNKVDVLILDINLKSRLTGLELAQKVREFNKDCYLIFTTGHLEYAMLAYKFKTFDYLAKPITSERLEDTIVRLFDDMFGQPKKYMKIDNKNTLINEADIQYIKREGMRLVYHTKDMDYFTYGSFNKIQPLLPENFVRCHKSYIVNVNNIKNINNSIIHFDKTGEIKCYIGQVYRKKFLEVFKNESYTNSNDT